MIKYADILYSTSKALKSKFPYKVNIKDNKKDMEAPTFYVVVTPLTSDSFVSYNEKLVNIVITYTDRVVTQESLLDIQDQLDDLFDMYLQVGKRKIVFDKKKFIRTKDLVNLTLTLNYLDDKANAPDADKYTKLMEELIYKEG